MVEALDDLDDAQGNSLALRMRPQTVSVDAVEGFLKVKTKLMYNCLCHSVHCSKMLRIVKI